MRAQLQRLAVISELPNVTIQVLPFDAHHALAVDSFAILRYGDVPGASLHDVVSVEHLSNELYVQGDDINQFNLAYSRIVEMSLSPEQSRDLILRVASRV